ncbi:unnamed protein product, partial [Iphiclides podalirius]
MNSSTSRYALRMLVLWLVLAVCILLWRWCKHSMSKLEPPECPGALPLFGHLHLIISDNTFIAGPDDALTVANACIEKHFVYAFARPWLGLGLITSPGAVWKRHRKLLDPAFSHHVLHRYMDVFNKQAHRLIEKVADHAETAMDFEFADGKAEDSEYMETVDKIIVIMFRRVQEPWLYFDILFKWSGLEKAQAKCLEILKNEFTKVLQRKKLQMKQISNVQPCEINGYEKGSEAKSKTFLELLLGLSERNGTFTDEEVRNHFDTIIVGGYDTVATTILFTTILIGSYPHVQERLLDELKNVCGETDSDVTRDNLSRLVYLDAIIKESLRIYSIIPAVARTIDMDVKLKNYTLRAGRTCIVSLYGIHRHQMWGEDAEEFRPERWLDPSTLPARANAFVAFSLGRRQCIGKAYAMISLKTTLAHFFRRYKVTADHTKMVLKMDVLLKPASGHEISIEKRSI